MLKKAPNFILSDDELDFVRTFAWVIQSDLTLLQAIKEISDFLEN